ncbi:MAG: HNH/ENDO VII family nuclease, partial [Fibromonadales bacterium]|nr:HNH/ENDO VII family nuclease [Fibromonadales bacterium]
PDGLAYHLHHIGQKADATLAILTRVEHISVENNLIWHPIREGSTVSHGSEWSKQVREFWNAVAKAQGAM